MIAGGASVTRVRKGFVTAGMAAAGAAMLGASLTNGHATIACFALAAVCNGAAHPMMFAISQTLGGPDGGGRWMGVQDLIGNLAGPLTPIAIGLIVQATGGLALAFAAAALTSLLGVACWALIVGRVEPIDRRS